MEDVKFLVETHVFDSKVYTGKEFFTITSMEVTDEEGKIVGFKYAVHITATDQETNRYREYLSEFEPKVVKYTREKPTSKVEWTIPEEDI